MGTGSKCGGRRESWGMGWFVSDEGGYTSVAVAVALLVSITLVFGVATSEWLLARSADVQAVADATAMAGSDAVAAYCTIAQVVDACVLSMGIAGVSVLGAGLVASAVPGGQGAAQKILDAGKKVLDSRRTFARSATKGLRGLEGALPFVVASNGWSCAHANSDGGLEYTGVAVPLPLDSQTDFSSIDDDVSSDEVVDAAERLQDATRRADEAKLRADDSRRRAWEADCVDNPSCLSSRAASLAGMGGLENPVASSPETWDFGMPIERARIYYERRRDQEAPDGSDNDSVVNSLARRAFYSYALDEVYSAYYFEQDDGSVDIMLPHLARNASEVRETWLYTDASWPCTDEEEQGLVLHATLSCEGAKGSYCGDASVADVEAGVVCECSVCRMGVGDLGRVASISTSATNGFEHYWQILVEESERYQDARNEQAEAEREMREVAEEGKGAFERVLDQLRVPRPRLCPPGAYGCIGVVARSSGTPAPSRLVSAFLSGQELPAGVAVSAATLAPDKATDGRDVLSSFFDGVASRQGFSVGGLVDGICGLWGRLLVSYGSSYERVGDAAGSFLDGVDGVFGGTVGSWLKRKVSAIIDAAGFEPADMRARKPVLTNIDDVLGRAGLNSLAQARAFAESLPAGAGAGEAARSLGIPVSDAGSTVTIAELPIPGTNASVPLSVNLQTMGG